MKLNMTAEEIDEKLRTLDPDISVFELQEIDDRIWRWVNEKDLNPAGKGWQYDLYQAPHYVSSIDDALTLRPVFVDVDGPKAADYILEHVNGGLTIGCRVGTVDPDNVVFADTDAQAVVRACLQAHIRDPGSLPLSDTPLRD